MEIGNKQSYGVYRADVQDEFTPYGYNVTPKIFMVNHACFKGDFLRAAQRYQGYLMGKNFRNNMDHAKIQTWERWVVVNHLAVRRANFPGDKY